MAGPEDGRPLAERIPGWPDLGRLRWDAAQAERYYREGWWSPRGLDQLLAGHAERTPNRAACCDGRTSVSYAELYRWSRSIAVGLLARGLAPGDVVVVRASGSLRLVAVIYALAAAGLVSYLLPTDSRSLDLAPVLTRTSASAVVTDSPLSAKDRESLAAPAVIISTAPGSGVSDLLSVEGLRDLPGAPPGQDPDTVSTLIPTSGTTGTPKIAMRSANCSLAMARTVVSRSRVSGDDVLLVAAPLYGGVGFINGICVPALTGCTLVLPADLQAATLLGLIKQYQVTRIATLPTLATRLMTFPGFAPVDVRTVGVIQTGGQQLPPSTAKGLESAFGCRVGITYGAIDVGVPAMVDSFADSADKRYTTVGRVAPGAELAILDPMGEILPPGKVGEVAMRGPDTAIGYFDDPQGTDAVFSMNGWGRLGDQGVLDDDGYLCLTGRIKEIVNRGGKKFSLAEVEAAVAQLDVVQDVAAVPYPDGDLGERCAVFLVSRDGQPVTLHGLTAGLAGRGVPKHLWPERVECLAALPVSGSGKVARAELRRRLISPR